MMRKIIASVQNHCCKKIKIFCPCTENELKSIVNFLYKGKITDQEESEVLEILWNLTKIFGFSENLFSIEDHSYHGYMSITEPLLEKESSQHSVSDSLNTEIVDLFEEKIEPNKKHIASRSKQEGTSAILYYPSNNNQNTGDPPNSRNIGGMEKPRILKPRILRNSLKRGMLIFRFI